MSKGKETMAELPTPQSCLVTAAPVRKLRPTEGHKLLTARQQLQGL